MFTCYIIIIRRKQATNSTINSISEVVSSTDNKHVYCVHCEPYGDHATSLLPSKDPSLHSQIASDLKSYYSSVMFSQVVTMHM